MRKSLLSSIFALFSISSCWTQAPTFEWVNGIGGSGFDAVSEIVSGTSGNIYVVGSFQNTVDFDSGIGETNLTSNGGYDIYIQKLDALGNLIWAKAIGGLGNDLSNSVTIDDNDNLYITGNFSETVDFDPGAGTENHVSNGGYDLYIMKISSSGAHLWSQSLGSTFNERGLSIQYDGTENLYLTGRYGGTVDFNPGVGIDNLVSNGADDIFILKLDTLGNYLWSKSVGGSSTDTGNDIEIDVSGNVYITGNFRNTVDFDPGLGVQNVTAVGPGGTRDVFVLKLDSSGSFQWVDSFGDTDDDDGWGLTIDIDGDIIVTGEFSGSVDFDPSPTVYTLTSNGGEDAFVLKLNTSGSLIWANSVGGTDYESGTSVTSDIHKNIYVVGYYQSSMDIDPGTSSNVISSNGSSDIFIQKLNSSGDYLWGTGVGGPGIDVGRSVQIDQDNSIVVAGDFSGTVDFNYEAGVSNETSNGNKDCFVKKYSQCNTTTGTDVITACESYTWIDGVTYTSSNNTATHVLTNTSGCDSLVTLDLTINNSNSGTDTITACESYTWIDGITYTSSNNTATHVLTNASGCDSLVTLDLTINNSNSGTDVITACDSYTWIDGVTYTSSNNTATHVLMNASGCDSLVTLDLTINNSNSGTDVITACDSYTWIDGVTYTSSNNAATHILTNVSGCDSLVTLDLTINNSNSGTDVITACESYTWIDGITYTSSNNTATHILTNASGCDSTITLNLTINSVNSDVTQTGNTLIANQPGAVYQWVNCPSMSPIGGETNQSFTATTNGEYAVIVTVNECSITSSCYTIDELGIAPTSLLPMKVFPNPTKDFVTIEFNKSQDISVEVRNSLGQLVFQSELINDHEFQLNLPNDSGVYFIEISTFNEIKTFKVIKN